MNPCSIHAYRLKSVFSGVSGLFVVVALEMRCVSELVGGSGKTLETGCLRGVVIDCYRTLETGCGGLRGVEVAW